MMLAFALNATAAQHTGLEEISPDNVQNLKRAFSFHTGDLNQGFDDKLHSQQAKPVYWNGRLYVSTSSNLVVAVDAGTGDELWRFDPNLNRKTDYSEGASRGVSVWHGESEICPDRIFIGTLSSKLYAINATTGERCSDFGVAGEVDLSKGIRNFREGQYSVTSPVAVLQDRIIVGSAIGDNGGVNCCGSGIRCPGIPPIPLM